VIAEVAGGPAVIKAPLLGPVEVESYISLGELAPLGLDRGPDGGTGLLTFPLGLTEEMVIAPPAPL
jgi:hypothetical protein